MPRTLYLLRHGQTEFNRDRRLQGQCDSPLTELGIAQARAMGATLRHLVGDAAGWQLWASPLGRTMHTARLVCDELGLNHAAIRAEPRVIEVGFGEWETLHVPTLHAGQPELAGRPDWHFAAPGGEPYAAVVARVRSLLDDPALPELLIVVAHGMLGRILRGAYLGLPPAEMWQQDMPQDALFRLHAGKVERIACVVPAEAADA